MNWYIKTQAQQKQRGPYALAQLIKFYQQGTFSKDSLVWVYKKDGWDWVKAEHVVELRDIFYSMPEEDTGDTPTQSELPTGIVDQVLPANLLSGKVWAVAGGKGGVGKSLISSSLAIGLTILGKKVILIDLDLGGPNVHTLFGISEPPKTICDFLMGTSSLKDLVIKTEVEGLFFISGKSGALGLADISDESRRKLISDLKTLECDTIVLDIGAGSAYHQLDFFIEADQGIVVTTPEPHAIQDAFHFLKTALLRKISQDLKDHPVIHQYFKENKHLRMDKLESLLQEIRRENADVANVIRVMVAQWCPRVILNQVMERKELKDGYFFIQSLKEMLHVHADYLGYVWFDRQVRRATQNLKPFLIDHPKSQAATCIFSMIVHKLLNHKYLNAKFKEMGLKKKVKGIEYETTYPGYRSGIGIYK